MRICLTALAATVCAVACSVTVAASRQDSSFACEKIAALRITHVELQARTIAAGTFTTDISAASDQAPAFCRVTGVIRPVADSRIGFELWLPRNAWNGRLKMLGNGGYSAALPLYEMGAQLRGGYAVVATDTGHSGDSPEFAIGHPESIVDWGHRAVHLTAVTARKIVQAFYGSLPRYAYFQGCSTGGHQAFMEAQRYPEDFDGIIAGAPGHNRTHLNAGFLWQFVQNHTADGQARQIIPTNKLQWVVKAAFASCRAQNGASAGGLASDEYLNDPLSCDFDPAALTCQAGDAEDCLTVEQVTALKRMYAGARNPRSGERIYFGWPPGSESSADGRMGWNIYWADPANPSAPARAGFWQHWALDDPQWDWRRFDFDRDMRRTDERLASTINAMNPSLEKFRRRGGKLIHYHGTADPVVPFADSISYWQRVIGKQRGMRDKQQRVAPADSAADAASEFYRLFVAPGLGHCQGGPGPAPVELQHALEDWVERGQAPDRMLARRESGGVNNEAFSRPLCPYPQIARYDDKGPPNTAESFICVTRTRAPQVAQPAADYLR